MIRRGTYDGVGLASKYLTISAGVAFIELDN